RVDYPLLAEPFDEALLDLDCPAIGPHVCAQDEDALVALHLLPPPLAQRLGIGDVAHHTLRNHSRSAAGGSPYTSESADSGPGAGSPRQASAAASISTRTRSSIPFSSCPSPHPLPRSRH